MLLAQDQRHTILSYTFLFLREIGYDDLLLTTDNASHINDCFLYFNPLGGLERSGILGGDKFFNPTENGQCAIHHVFGRRQARKQATSQQFETHTDSDGTNACCDAAWNQRVV